MSDKALENLNLTEEDIDVAADAKTDVDTIELDTKETMVCSPEFKEGCKDIEED